MFKAYKMFNKRDGWFYDYRNDKFDLVPGKLIISSELGNVPYIQLHNSLSSLQEYYIKSKDGEDFFVEFEFLPSDLIGGNPFPSYASDVFVKQARILRLIPAQKKEAVKKTYTFIDYGRFKKRIFRNLPFVIQELEAEYYIEDSHLLTSPTNRMAGVVYPNVEGWEIREQRRYDTEDLIELTFFGKEELSTTPSQGVGFPAREKE